MLHLLNVVLLLRVANAELLQKKKFVLFIVELLVVRGLFGGFLFELNYYN
jgi:hypothetical protein